ncbi:MAG: lasso RiPP family leader peptide-containing protein [Gemmatimonadaceae bacterium]|nr:lasso RiPP family leader peptide-containing protein [Gemmatimonadaceae bacterium]
MSSTNVNPPRAPYGAPTLVVIGSLAEVTATNSMTGMADGGGGAMNRTG